MKFPRLLLAVLASVVLLPGGQGTPRVHYFGHEQVSAGLGGTDHFSVLLNAPDLIVMCSHRKGPGHVELHVKESDVFYVTDGEGTLITGGKMVGSHVSSPGQLAGTDIIGGEIHHLSKGDVIVIPAGIPHWFKEVPHSISYCVVKGLKQ